MAAGEDPAIAWQRRVTRFYGRNPDVDAWRSSVARFYGVTARRPEVWDRYAVWDHWIELWCQRIANKFDNSIVITGLVGCWAAGQRVLKYDGTSVAVEDVRVGDVLMGPDSSPRPVREVFRGTAPLYDVVPTKGQSMRVTGNHVLVLAHTNGLSHGQLVDRRDKLLEMTVERYLQSASKNRLSFKLVRTGVNFEKRADELPIPPYVLGVFLGDGMLIAGETRFVPRAYKTASRQQRLDLLAGLLDTDGSRWERNGYDYVSKSQRLAEDVAFVSRSLGFAAYVHPCEKRDQNGHGGIYYHVNISGDTTVIPVRIGRKRSLPRLQAKDVLRTGFAIRPAGVGAYYGFHTEGDGRVLMDDFTITHQTGKSTLALEVGLAIRDRLTQGKVPLDLHRDVLYSLDALLQRLVDSKPGDVVVADEAVLLAQATAGGTPEIYILERALTLSRELGVTLILCIPYIQALAKGVRERRVEFWVHVEERGYATVHELKRRLSYKMEQNDLPFRKADEPFTHVEFDPFAPTDPLWVDYSKLKHERTVAEIRKALSQVRRGERKRNAEPRRRQSHEDDEGENTQRTSGGSSGLTDE